MIKKCIIRYVCEKCGQEFKSSIECETHEKTCGSKGLLNENK